MSQLGYSMANYAKNSISVGFPGQGHIRVGLPNCLYFQKDNDINPDEIKDVLDTVKDDYLKFILSKLISR